MALATEDDVEAALGRPLTSAEDVTYWLENASDLVCSILGGTPDPVPGPVTRVVADMVVALLTKPATTVAQYGAGGYNQIREAATVTVGTESATSTGPWDTKSLRKRLRPYMIIGGRAFTIDTTPPFDDEE